ncbi:MAG: hypothetical protein WA705_04975 [Candidatus Ozemobacteraceae bacterium]
MIKAELFRRSFEGGFTPNASSTELVRQSGKLIKWEKSFDGNRLVLIFPVNPKASAIPYCPGEFWPVIYWTGPKYNERDDGLISYYQYASQADIEEIQQLRKAVIKKVGEQNVFDHEVYHGIRDASLGSILAGLDAPLAPNHPHTALYYLDEDDAESWGAWFGSHIEAWIVRFRAAPETLEAWCWRNIWKDLPKTGGNA